MLHKTSLNESPFDSHSCFGGRMILSTITTRHTDIKHGRPGGYSGILAMGCPNEAKLLDPKKVQRPRTLPKKVQLNTNNNNNSREFQTVFVS